MGKFNESLKAFDQAIALNPNESSYYIAKSQCLDRSGETG